MVVRNYMKRVIGTKKERKDFSEVLIIMITLTILLSLSFMSASASSQYSDNEIIVVVTPTGECYHNINCEWVGENYRKITLEQAKAEGYRDCKVCDIYGAGMEIVKQNGTLNFSYTTPIFMLIGILLIGSLVTSTAIQKRKEAKAYAKSIRDEEAKKNQQAEIEKKKTEIEKEEIIKAVRDAITEIDSFFADEEKIISESETRLFHIKWNDLYMKMKRNSLEYGQNSLEYGQDTEIIRFVDLYAHLSEKVVLHNETAKKRLIGKADRLVNPVEGRCLDKQQLESIAIPCSNHLVIAGAGTGKTTTIVGYIKYLLLSGKCKPEEILALSFTNASAKELSERVKNEANIYLDIFTFHKLGINIIHSVERETNRTYNYYTKTRTFVRDSIKKLSKNPHYSARLLEYVLYFANYDISPNDFCDKESYEIYRKSHPPISLKKEELKSNGEVDIANFLYLNDVEYIYEMPYKHNTATDGIHRQYYPDFYLPKYDVYIEFFGIDEYGNVPGSWGGRNGKSAKELYNDGIEWKREIHLKYKTTMIETFFYERKHGTLISSLKKQLEKAGVELKPKKEEEVWEKLGGTKEQQLEKVSQVVESVINLSKSQNYTLDDLRMINERNGNDASIDILLSLVEPVYTEYQSMLKNTGAIDFNDMISLATQMVESDRYIHNYKYVIIDEYQDISKARYGLIKALRNTKDFELFCVGDDWQSIYRFAGSDVNFILDFEKYWGETRISYIEKTYRFPQSLCNVSGQFIMKNQSQMKKKMVSYINGSAFAMGTIVADTGKEYIDCLVETLKSLPIESTVFLLGRYTFDINYIAQSDRFSVSYDANTKEKKVVLKERSELFIRFKTLHESKGSQADYVIIINNKADSFGFPSTILEPPIMKYLLEKDDSYPFSEERRLFYVGLTRARKKVWLLYPEDNKSIFVSEILDDNKDELKNEEKQCVACGGKLIPSNEPGELICSKCNHRQYRKRNKRCPLCGGKLKTRHYLSNEVLGCENYFSSNKCYYMEDPLTGNRFLPENKGVNIIERNVKNSPDSDEYKRCEKVVEQSPCCPMCGSRTEVAKGIMGPFVRCENPFCTFIIPNNERHVYVPQTKEPIIHKPIVKKVVEGTKTDYKVVMENGWITITKYIGSDEKEVFVPNRIDGAQVRVIGENAFAKCTGIEKVVISEGITEIHNGAFFGCKSLKKVILPTTLQKLGNLPLELTEMNIWEDPQYNGVFESCAIEEIQLPASLIYIGGNAFRNCNKLCKINLPNKIKTLPECCFAGCIALEEVLLPDNMNSIGECAFYDTGIMCIDIPASVTEIKRAAFKKCKRLTKVLLHEGLQTIKDGAFSECISLCEIKIPKSVIMKGTRIF